MKQTIRMLAVLLLVSICPSLVFAHGEEDHGDSFHIDIVHIMDAGFHGKLDGKVVADKTFCVVEATDR